MTQWEENIRQKIIAAKHEISRSSSLAVGKLPWNLILLNLVKDELPPTMNIERIAGQVPKLTQIPSKNELR